MHSQTGDGGQRADDVARALRAAIAEGRLRPGEQVRQEAVAAELGVSRIPVREALRQLEGEGLVVFRANSGARVAVLDLEECEEIYKMRERLEPLALSESLRAITDEQVAVLAALADELRGRAGDPHDWIAGDRAFHLACYAGVSTPRLLAAIVGYWNATHPYRRVLVAPFADRDFDLVHTEHTLIVDAIARRNARVGEELLRAHIERSRLRLTENAHLLRALRAA